MRHNINKRQLTSKTFEKDSQKPLYQSTRHLINILVSERDFDRIVCRYKSTSLLQWKDNVTKG